METQANSRAWWRIRRFKKGRGCKRYLTQESVELYKKRYPNYEFRQLTPYVTGPPKQQPQPQVSSKGTAYSSIWGRNPREIDEAARWTQNAVISYDDILDTLLAAGKGI